MHIEAGLWMIVILTVCVTNGSFLETTQGPGDIFKWVCVCSATILMLLEAQVSSQPGPYIILEFSDKINIL